jgi:hypothetical protein
MQTFLSEQTFAESAAVLDNKRLNKQLLEGYQILKAISQTPDGGGSRIDGKVPFASNHPVTNQWRGSEAVLCLYLGHIMTECDLRGIKWDKNWANICDLFHNNPQLADNLILPDWYVDNSARRRVLMTHRRNLWWKDHDYYEQYMADARMVDSEPVVWVCCTTHAPYYYPTH